MYGAESLIQTLVNSGVEVCFANPGTSEMHLVTAIDTVDGMRPVLGLFEGVVTGMADGYARVAEKPAATLLHLGPGLANGLANLHNARRASSPIVNIVGDHATYHLQLDAPLTSDIVGFARPVSGWIHTATNVLSVSSDAARAVHASRQAPGQIATLILPANIAWTEGGVVADPLPVDSPAAWDEAAVSRAQAAIKSGKKVGILMRGECLKERGLQAAGRVAVANNVRLMCDTFAPRIQKGAGRVEVTRLPYFAEQLVEYMADLDVLVLVGTKPPVTFFAYPGKPSWGADDRTEIMFLSHPHQDGVGALEALADVLATTVKPVVAQFFVDDAVGDVFDQFAIGRAIARHLPEGAIISDEGGTQGGGTQRALATAAPHDQLSLTGGAIGQGLPVATGAAVAAKGDQKVVCLHGDGGAMYTVQALWTQARENLDVTTVIFSNRAYAILQIELHRTGAGAGGPKAQSMLSLDNPAINWVKIAEGFGVEAVRVDSPQAFESAFAAAMAQRGPRLIEAIL